MQTFQLIDEDSIPELPTLRYHAAAATFLYKVAEQLVIRGWADPMAETVEDIIDWDEEHNCYSLDSAFDAFEQGETVEEYIEEVGAKRLARSFGVIRFH